jgi:hypothetical protein
VKTTRAACSIARLSISRNAVHCRGSEGYPSSVIESRKSAIHGSPVRRESRYPIRCAVAIGYVVQIAAGR